MKLNKIDVEIMFDLNKSQRDYKILKKKLIILFCFIVITTINVIELAG